MGVRYCGEWHGGARTHGRGAPTVLLARTPLPRAEYTFTQNHALFCLEALQILVVTEKHWRYGMAPAHDMVFICQERSTENAIIQPTIYSQRG